jgi:glycosyltransferase involved in cell wall biosynthesis
MGRAGRARALETFDWPAIAARTSELYRSLA